MKQGGHVMFRTALATVAFCLLGGAAFADPLEGTWSTVADDNGNTGHVEVVPCGDRYCGTLVRAFDSGGNQITTPNVGRQIIWDMAALGDGRYGKGKIFSPDRGKTYNSRLNLSGNSLTVKGCILGICRDGGTWQRVN
jgi:uncharacterized protein (DUF2147 family)